MKSRIQHTPHTPDASFPCLMIYVKDEDFVVLFVSPDAGVVVHTETNQWSLGDYREDWVIDNFTYFPGEVTLTN